MIVVNLVLEWALVKQINADNSVEVSFKFKCASSTIKFDVYCIIKLLIVVLQ